MLSSPAQMRQMNFGGVRLKLHPDRMGGGRHNSRFWHAALQTGYDFHFSRRKSEAQWTEA